MDTGYNISIWADLKGNCYFYKMDEIIFGISTNVMTVSYMYLINYFIEYEWILNVFWFTLFIFFNLSTYLMYYNWRIEDIGFLIKTNKMRIFILSLSFALHGYMVMILNYNLSYFDNSIICKMGVFFSLIISRYYLKKKYNWQHYFSMFLIVLSVSIKFADNMEKSALLYVCLAVINSFIISCINIYIEDKLQVYDKKVLLWNLLFYQLVSVPILYPLIYVPVNKMVSTINFGEYLINFFAIFFGHGIIVLIIFINTVAAVLNNLYSFVMIQKRSANYYYIFSLFIGDSSIFVLYVLEKLGLEILQGKEIFGLNTINIVSICINFLGLVFYYLGNKRIEQEKKRCDELSIQLLL